MFRQLLSLAKKTYGAVRQMKLAKIPMFPVYMYPHTDTHICSNRQAGKLKL